VTAQKEATKTYYSHSSHKTVIHTWPSCKYKYNPLKYYGILLM